MIDFLAFLGIVFGLWIIFWTIFYFMDIDPYEPAHGECRIIKTFEGSFNIQRYSRITARWNLLDSCSTLEKAKREKKKLQARYNYIPPVVG